MSDSFTKCEKCGEEIANGGNFCSKCGEKVKNNTPLLNSQKPLEGKKSFIKKIFIGFFAILGILFLTIIVGTYLFNSPNTSESKYINYSLDEIKREARPYLYDNYARNPEDYQGKLFKINGVVNQVQQTGDTYVLRVFVNGDSSKDVWINAKNPSIRPLENDKILFYCVFNGLKTYNTVLGSSRTIPELTYLSQKM